MRKKRQMTRNKLVTDRALELYRRGLALRDFRDKCIESDEMCVHAECTESNEISVELNRLLGLRPHHPSPVADYDEIQTWPNNGGPVAKIKKALDAALQAEIAPPAGEDRSDE